MESNLKTAGVFKIEVNSDAFLFILLSFLSSIICQNSWLDLFCQNRLRG